MPSFKLLRDLLKKPKPSNESNPLEHPVPNNSRSLSDTQLLYAFRSIMLMLSLIHSRKRITNTKFETAPDLRKELKTLDALAAIAIRHHGVATATMAKHNNATATLEVLTIPDSPFTHFPGPTISQTSSTTKVNDWGIMNFLLTLNPRSDCSINKEPTNGPLRSLIVDPDTKIPERLKLCEESDLLKTYLMNVW